MARSLVLASFLPKAPWPLHRYKPGIASILIRAPTTWWMGDMNSPVIKVWVNLSLETGAAWTFSSIAKMSIFWRKHLHFGFLMDMPPIKSEIRAYEFFLKNDTIFQTKRLRLTQGMWSTYLWSKHNSYLLPDLMHQNLALDMCSNSLAFSCSLSITMIHPWQWKHICASDACRKRASLPWEINTPTTERQKMVQRVKHSEGHQQWDFLQTS